MTSTLSFVPTKESQRERKIRLDLERQTESALKEAHRLLEPDDFPKSKMPAAGWKMKHNLRGQAEASQPVHRASSLNLAVAYPFLAETGDPLRGAYVGPNMMSKGQFCFDPWNAYEDEIIRSHSGVVLGVKGTGKTMLMKSWSTRLIRFGRKVAVPFDPNGEWTPVAEYVGGDTVAIGPGSGNRVNPYHPGKQPTDLSRDDWIHLTLQNRRAMTKTMMSIMRKTAGLADEEHTAIDMAVENVMLRGGSDMVIGQVLDEIRHPSTNLATAVENEVLRKVAHTLRRLTEGDLKGLIDGPSTVEFNIHSPMMTVDTSRLRSASYEAKAISRACTDRWMREATLGANREKRLVVHEEAAVKLLNDVMMSSGGSGLVEQVQKEKVARHDGEANYYVLHAISDLDTLGDRGSAVLAQAYALLAGCETRISYAQHLAEVRRSKEILGWNEVQATKVRKLKKGQGLWQIGEDRVALVKNVCTAGEMARFRTDRLGGVRT